MHLFVLKLLKTLSLKESISFKLWSYKVSMLCALASFNRADTLHKSDLHFRIFKPDGVLFKLCSVSNTVKPSKPIFTCQYLKSKVQNSSFSIRTKNPLSLTCQWRCFISCSTSVPRSSCNGLPRNASSNLTYFLLKKILLSAIFSTYCESKIWN